MSEPEEESTPEISSAPEATASAPSPTRSAPSLLKAAGLIAAVTILSKLLGAVRDWAIVNGYGLSLATDAYFAAFQIPSFVIVLLGGLGGPFHTATVAVFTKLLKDSDHATDDARQLASTFLTLTGLAGAILSVATFVAAEPIMRLILSNDNPALVQASAEQLRIMSPVIFAGALVGIFYGISNIFNMFLMPSLSPTGMSITLLIALWFFPFDPTGRILAWATLAGGFLQLFMQIPEFLRQKFSLRPSLKNWKSAEMRHVGELLFPATIGTTIGQLMAYVDMFFTSALKEGGWSAVTLANRLIQLPIGVLQTALLVPIFPRFTRFVAEENFGELKRYFQMGVVSLWFISMPILVLMLCYTRPIISVIFQHGNFDADDTDMVSLALIFLAFQMVAYFARDSITRVFYAFHDSKTPMIIGMIAIVFKALFDWLFTQVYRLDVGGITFSSTLVTFINMVLLGVLSKRHIKDLGFREMVLPFLKLTGAAILMGVMIQLVALALSAVELGFMSDLHSRAREIVMIVLSASVGIVSYILCTIALQVQEAQYIFDRFGGLLGRFRKR